MADADACEAPRWEWRTFASSLAWLEARTGPQGPVEPFLISEETYLLNPRTPHSAKIRGGALDVKRLERIDPTGLELWRRAFKGVFPLPAPRLCAAFSALGLPPPVLRRDAYALDLFLADIVEPDAFFRAVKVSKARRQFTFAGCRAEFARVEAGGARRESFCVEHEAAELVLAALRRLGLDSHANVNFPAGLGRALADRA
jgi:hypothetical protein